MYLGSFNMSQKKYFPNMVDKEANAITYSCSSDHINT